MEDLGNILEHELENAFEVKDKNSLHRYITLLVDNTVGRREYDGGIGELKSDVRLIAERMDEGFKRMDERFTAVDKRFESMQRQMDQRFESVQTQMNQRFEAVDKRFEDMNSRFTTIVALLLAGFTVVTSLITVIKFIL